MNPDLADLVALAEAIAVEGPPGPRGEPGIGSPGRDGRSIVSGEGAPTEATGSPGDLYIDLVTGDLWQLD